MMMGLFQQGVEREALRKRAEDLAMQS